MYSRQKIKRQARNPRGAGWNIGGAFLVLVVIVFILRACFG